MNDHETSESPREYYNAIADKYDWFYASWDSAGAAHREALAPLFEEHGVRRVLDCACGDGLQAIALAEAGYDVVGSDLSEGMLEQARLKCQEAGVSFPLFQSDVRKLDTKVQGRFDAVVCMGNVLPHLMSDRDILQALGNMHRALEPKGLLVLEGRYYDELVRSKERFLPHRVHAQEGHDQSVTILYVLDHFESHIRFNIVFLVKDEEGEVSVDVDTVDYNPIVTDHLRELVTEAGFGAPRIERQGDRILCAAVKA